MLDRYERMSLANSIYTHLNEIRYKVDGMMLMAQYATLNDLCFAIDPEMGQHCHHEKPCGRIGIGLERTGGC